MDAITFLINGHNKVRSLLVDIADGNHKFDTQKKHFELLAQNLIDHENMEHDVWYPNFIDDLPDTVKHLVREEKTAEKEIKKIEDLKSESSWKEHFKKFKQNVEHHAQEEEQKLFPEVVKILSKKQLDDIGTSMASYKKSH